VVNATILWFEPAGPTGTFKVYGLGSYAMPVYLYTLISILVTLAFLWATSRFLVTELSDRDQVKALDEKTSSLQANQEIHRRSLLEIQSRITDVDQSVDHANTNLTAEISNQGDAIKKSIEAGNKSIDEKESSLQTNQESQQKVLLDVQSKASEVYDSLDQTGKKLSDEISSQGKALKQTIEVGEQNHQKLWDGIEGRMFFVDENLNEVKKKLGEQTELIKTVDANFASNVTSQLADLKETLAKLESKDEKTNAALAKQRNEIEEIKLTLERIEGSFVTPKPLLTSNSNVEDVKGIGPNKTAELREIGITSASDLVMADPKVVADKIGSSEKTVEKLQGRAQLAMIPGIREKDLLLLEDLDINDRKTLASQDPIELGKRLNAIFKIDLAKGKVAETDRPSIGEVESWVRYTRT